MLLTDWRQLGLDARLQGWTPADLLWWLTGDATAEYRRADFRLAQMVYRNPDPVLRFAIVEAMEAAHVPVHRAGGGGRRSGAGCKQACTR